MKKILWNVPVADQPDLLGPRGPLQDVQLSFLVSQGDGDGGHNVFPQVIHEERGRGMAITSQARNGRILERLLVRMYTKVFFRSSKMSLHSSTVWTMVARLSASPNTLAASLDTSEQEIPR